MIKIGIECESIEDRSWGVAKTVSKLLQELSQRKELQNEFKFFLYFKSKIPDHAYLDSPVFEKKLVGTSFLPTSFSLYYYLLLPIRLWLDQLDLVFFPNYMLPLIFHGKSLVLTTDDIYYEMRGRLPFRYRMAYKIFGNWAVKKATGLMAISNSSKNEIVRLFKVKPERVFVNYLATDAPKKASENNYGKYILFVAQAFERRHLKETMLSFRTIAKEHPGIKLVIIGPDKYNPPILDSLRKEISDDLGVGHVVHKNRVSESELVNLYAHAKLLVYVSSREAFGLPPMEALSYGLPSVLADKPVSRELFGDNAFFVKKLFDVEAMTVALNDALYNTNKIVQIKNASSDIVSKFTWKSHTDRFLDITRSLCKKT
jgi:glycosyltransferase involved in cell wall biosynthesis